MRRKTSHWERRHFLALANTVVLVAVGLAACEGGEARDGTITTEASRRPLSGMVALTFVDDLGTGAADLGQYVRTRVNQVATGTLPPGVQFPLANAATDSVRAIAGLSGNVVVAWLDPLTFDQSHAAPRFGANNDYIAFFGDRLERRAGRRAAMERQRSLRLRSGSTTSTSRTTPRPRRRRRRGSTSRSRPTSARWTSSRTTSARTNGRTRAARRTCRRRSGRVGGSWFHVVQDPASGEWEVDRGAKAVRYDATSNTLVRITGLSTPPSDHDDQGNALPPGVVTGIMGDCSGGQTPWGTVITAEENVQDYYGDLEAFWTSEQKLVLGAGADPGGPITFDTTTSPDE